MEKIPFSVYDLFAYLFSGGVVLVTADYIWGAGVLFKKDVGSIFIFVLVLFAYVIGQIMAQLSSFIFENLLVKRLLTSPSLLLLGGAPRNSVLKFVFPLYHRALPASVQGQVVKKAASRGCHAAGEGLFLHAYPIVTANDRIQNRLDDFRNQYGFARNMSMAFLVSTVAITVGHWVGPNPVKFRWAILAGAASLCMLYRYLKFFRQFSYELLIRYAELPAS